MKIEAIWLSLLLLLLPPLMLGLLDELLPSQVEKKEKKETKETEIERKERIISERYEKVISSPHK